MAYSPRDGGFTAAIHDLLETCSRLPEIEFVIVHDRRYSEAFSYFGLPQYQVAVPARLKFFASLVLMPFIVRRIGASAVHCEISAIPWLVGVPGSVTVHDLWGQIGPRQRDRSVQRRVMRLYWDRVFIASVRRARVVKAVSQTTADDLARLVSPDLPVVVAWPRFLAPSEPNPVRRTPTPSEDLRLLFVGNIVPRKNLPFLIAALRLVHRPWRLDVVGGLWWGMDDLGSMIRDGRVQVHGYVPDSERDRLMAQSHLLVAPSHYEGFGYPVAEAMIRGLPVLTSDAGAYRDFVPSEWRFPLDDPSVLASMIESLGEERLAAAEAASKYVRARFDAEHHLDGHRQLFSRLVSPP